MVNSQWSLTLSDWHFIFEVLFLLINVLKNSPGNSLNFVFATPARLSHLPNDSVAQAAWMEEYPQILLAMAYSC